MRNKNNSKKDINNNSIEHINRIIYYSNYRINESPRYCSYIKNNLDDNISTPVNEVGDQEDAPKIDGGEVPPAPSNLEPILVTILPEEKTDILPEQKIDGNDDSLSVW